MSFSFDKRNSIIRYMLEKIRENDADFISKVAENYMISVTSVKRYIKQCLDEKKIEADKKTACGYILKKSEKQWTFDISQMSEEDKVFYQEILPCLQEVSKEGQRIWSYAFMEMMNNAMEHSAGSEIRCHVTKDVLFTEISITDDGVGIFTKLKEYLQDVLGREVDEKDVMTELHKGKLTTAKEKHSGEGIFFTSKMLDSFAIWSENQVFAYSSSTNEKMVQSHLLSYYTKLNKIGTMVVMKLSNDTERTSKEVFDMYAPIEKGFVKTRIPVGEICPCNEAISRSQARKILYRLEEFEEVELDFSEIEFMGQGFADEVFRVFCNKNPNVKITAVNVCEDVDRMIKHVTARI